MESRNGFEYVGKVPDYLVIAPIQRLAANMGLCAGCSNMIHFMNYESAICPICASKQALSQPQGEPNVK